MQVRIEDDVDELVRAAKLLAVASAWSERGLWDELAGRSEPVDLRELPGDTRALTITAAVLAHAGLLDGGGRHWRLSDRARELHKAGALPTARNLDWLGDLGRMSQVLEEGGPVRGPDGTSKVTSVGVRPDDPEATRRFLEMLYRRGDRGADTVAKWILPRLPEGARVLDVGGGHGRYAEAFATRGCRVTLFDLPLVTDIARERYGDRLAYRAGDFHTDPFGGPYDAALLSNIVHGESPHANGDMTRRLFQALNPGGWLVVRDMFIDEQGRDPDNAVFFGVTMLFYTEAGQSYALDDVAGWCRAAGFEPPERIRVGDYTLVLARKPV